MRWRPEFQVRRGCPRTRGTWRVLWAWALIAAGLAWTGCASSENAPAAPAQLAPTPRTTPAGESPPPATPLTPPVPPDGQVMPLETDAQFEAALWNRKPVLMYFYKGGCPSCYPTDPLVAALAREYAGRVAVYKFMLMTPVLAVTSPALKSRYEVASFPTVILFVDGLETWRLLANYNIHAYRKAINEALGATAGGVSSGGTPE